LLVINLSGHFSTIVICVLYIFLEFFVVLPPLGFFLEPSFFLLLEKAGFLLFGLILNLAGDPIASLRECAQALLDGLQHFF